MPNPFPSLPVPPDLAYQFLGTFARCEYALKGSGFAKGDAKSVEADWDLFADAVDWHLRRVKDEAFDKAVTFLLTEPPRKQVLSGGKLIWKDSPPDANLPKARQVLLMVRRVRNNLFHGAKVWSPEHDNGDRDARLIGAGLVVLGQCSQLNKDVQRAFAYVVF